MKKLIFIYIPSKYANDFKTKFHIRNYVVLYHRIYIEDIIDNTEDIATILSNYDIRFYHIHDKVLNSIIKYRDVELPSFKSGSLPINLFNDLYNRADTQFYPHYVVRFKDKNTLEIVDECIININDDDKIEITNKVVLDKLEKEEREGKGEDIKEEKE